MFNVLDSAIFSLLNEYARNPFLDRVLPFFSLSWPLWLGVFFFFSFFIFHCRKHYGDALWRLLVLGIVLGISVGVSGLGASLMKDGFGRYRPYQALSGTIYYDASDDAWVQIQITPTMANDDLNSIDDVKKIDDVETIDDVKTDIALQDILLLPPITLPPVALLNDAELNDSIESDIVTDESISDVDVLLNAESDVIINDVIINDVVPNAESEISSMKSTLETQNISTEVQDTSDSYKVAKYSQAQLQTMFDTESSSMPSTFAANAMAMAIVIALLFHKTSPWIYMMPVLVGWARVYTGNSYPMDILVGWIWGILAVAIAWLICDVMFRFVSKNRKL